MGRTLSTGSRHPVASTSGHAAIYTRISDDKEGDELGVARQLEDCRTKAEREGYTVVGVFSDNDISASTKSKKARPQYADMLARARDGQFSTIIAYSNSRITRRPRELEDLIVLFERHGTVVRTVVSGDDDLSTADGRMTARIKAAVDAAEAERIGERVARTAKQRRESGRWHGGVPPFGYRREEKTLHLEASEASLIRDAAARILDQDETLYGIVKDWNARGIPTRKASVWRHATLSKSLTNPALIGTNSAGVEDCWEPVLDRVTFDRLVEKLAPDHSRRTNSLGVKSSKYALGGGLVVCDACGKPLSVVARKSQGTVKMVCRTFMTGPDEVNHPTVDGKSTGRVSIDHDALMAYLFEKSRAHLNDLPFWENVKRKRESADSDLTVLRADRDARQGERDRAGRAYIAGIMSEREAQAEVARLDAEIERLTRQIEHGHGGPTAYDVWAGRDEALDLWDGWRDSDRRLFFRGIIQRVRVGQWPDGIPTTTLPRAGESDAMFRARREGVAREAMAARVDIEWRE